MSLSIGFVDADAKNILDSNVIINDYYTGIITASSNYSVKLPYIFSGGSNRIIASFAYINHQKGIVNDYNNLFGNINLKTIFEREDFTLKQGSYVNHLRSVLINENEDIGVYQTKLILEGTYISDTNPPNSTPTSDELSKKNLRTYILLPQKSTNINFKGNNLTAGYYSVKDAQDYLKKVYFGGEIWKGMIKDGSDNIDSLIYQAENDEEFIIYQLGISQANYLFLESKAIAIDTNATNFFFHLEEDTTSYSNTFIKYKLRIRFDKKDGTTGLTTDFITLYTLDNYFFFTKDYSTNFKYYKEFPKITAEFLLRDIYNGEFGFDWLRKGDIDGVIKDKPFNKIVAYHYKSSDHSVLEDNNNKWDGFYKFNREKYLKLKNKEYRALPVNWKLSSESNDYEKDSAVSYLNIYRKGVTPNPRAKLRLLIRVSQKSKLYIKYPKDLFAIRLTDGVTAPDSNSLDGIYRLLEIPLTSIPANNAKAFINLEIENIADIGQDTAITIHTETGEICGKMMVLKNDEVLIKKIQIVKFRDSLPVDANNVGEQDAEVNGLDNINLFLKHANIQAEYATNIVINITNDSNFNNIKIDPVIPPNQNPKYDLVDPSKPTAHNNNLKSNSRFRINLSNTDLAAMASKNSFELHVGISNLKNYNDHLILCYTDRISSGGTKAFAHDTHYMFIAKDIPVDAYAHEVYHALGIDHTFDNEGEYVYMNGLFSLFNNTDKTLINPASTTDPSYQDNNMTDNLMDYFITRRTTYKWQWAIMRKKIKKIT